MKRLLVAYACLALGATASFGAVPCSTQAAATINGYTCSIGDKTYSNFTQTGIASGTVSFAQAGTQFFVHYDTLSAPVTAPFTLGFTVTIDLAVCSTCTIIQMVDQMLTANTTLGNPAIPNSSTAVVTHTPGGVVSLDALTAGDQTGIVPLSTVSESVLFSYSPGPTGEDALTQFNISQMTTPAVNDGPFLIRYAANLNVGDSVVNFINTGNNVPAGGGSPDDICVNTYAFSPDEQ
jgi:hypothetical protein